MVHPTLAQIVFVTGIINVLSFVFIFFSCRCFSGNLLFKLMKYKKFRKFYHNHCYYWWVFAISVLIHSTLALYVIGIPF